MSEAPQTARDAAPEAPGCAPSRDGAGCAWFAAGAAVGLAVLFAALKLAGATGWPWWEVLAPLWLGAGLAALAVAADALVLAGRRPQEPEHGRKDQ